MSLLKEGDYTVKRPWEKIGEGESGEEEDGEEGEEGGRGGGGMDEGENDEKGGNERRIESERE